MIADTTKKLIGMMKAGVPAETAISGTSCNDWDMAASPIKGKPDYLKLTKAGYSDAKMATRFRSFLPAYYDKYIDKMDDILKSEEDTLLCRQCGNPIDNEAEFCKFCGKRINKEVNIGRSIRDIRRKNNMKLSEFASRLNIVTSTPNFWEKGRNQPSIDKIIMISEQFNCSVNEVVGQPELRDSLTFEPLIETDDGYKCPHCGEEVFLSIGEALSIDLETYEDVRIFSDGNDGYFCKHCGNGIIRPVERDEEKEFESYRYWLEKAYLKVRK